VLHIDGLSNEPIPVISIAPGTRLDELVRQFGGTIRVEHVPDAPAEPRSLSSEAAKFIQAYGPEEDGAVLAIYWSHHSLEAEEFDTAAEATRFLEGGEEYEWLAGEAVVDGEQITVWD
jgi:hypothetical protein